MRLLTRSTAAVLMVLLGGIACVSTGTESPWRLFTGRLPGEHVRVPETRAIRWVGQIVDRETLAPVAGARVRVYSESGAIVIDGRSTLLAEAWADGDGFVEVGVPFAPRPSQWLVDAPGFATKTETAFWRGWPSEPDLTSPGAVIELSRGRPLFGRIVDPLGRPVPGVHVSRFEGCRHAPPHERTISDAEGRFRFGPSDARGIWIQGGGVAGTYAEDMRDVDGGALIVAEAGVTLEGRVLTPEGRPLSGIWVRTWERGPATRTDGEGRFRLEGAQVGTTVGLATDRLPETNGVVVKTHQADVVRDPKQLRLAFDPATGEAADLPDLVRVEFRPGPGAEGASVTIISATCGLAERAVVTGGVARLHVPRGKCEVRVGSPFGVVWWRPFTVELLESGAVPLPDLRPVIDRPSLRFRLPDLGRREMERGYGGWVALWTAEGEFRSIEDLDRPVPVPAGVPLALHVKSPARPLAILPFELPPGTTGTVERTLRLDTPVDGTFVLYEGGTPDVWFRCAPGGRFHRGFVWYRGGTFDFVGPRGATGEMYVEMIRGERGALVEIPPDSLERTHVPLAGPREVEVIVRDEQGRPVPDANVEISMLAAEGMNDQVGVTDGAGMANFRRLQPVDRVRVGGPDDWVHAFPVTRRGRIEVEVPGSTVLLSVPEGPYPHAWLKGRQMASVGEPRGLALRYVPAGRHRLVVEWPDGGRWIREIVVRTGEDLRIPLPGSR